MKLFNKIRELLARKEEPEQFDDMYITPGIPPIDRFHDALNSIVEIKGVSYFEAFVGYMNASSVNTNNREVFENYLYGKGLCKEDVENLVDEYYRLTST